MELKTAIVTRNNGTFSDNDTRLQVGAKRSLHRETNSALIMKHYQFLLKIYEALLFTPISPTTPMNSGAGVRMFVTPHLIGYTYIETTTARLQRMPRFGINMYFSLNGVFGPKNHKYRTA